MSRSGLGLERRVRRVVAPVTTPRSRRMLIAARDRAVAEVARARSARGLGGLPGIVIAGAQKAGTTFLHQELARHPDVAPALTKELHFFDDRWSLGLDRYRGYFAGDGRLGLESSPGYVFHPHALARLAAHVPDALVLLVLRDPVLRAHSHHRHEVRLGYEPCTSFEDALAREPDRLAGERQRMVDDPTYVSFAWRHHSYLARGEYDAQVAAALDVLGHDRLLVLRSEDLYRDPLETLDRVQRFIGLDPWQPDEPGRNDMASNGGPLAPATAARLAEHFAAHNQRLADRLCWRDLDWT